MAKALQAPLDVLVVRKLGVPFQPELALGAIGEGGVRVINEAVVREADLSEHEIAAVEASSGPNWRRARNVSAVGMTGLAGGRTAVIVDDGVATGATAKAACQVARALGASPGGVGRPDRRRRDIAERFSDTPTR